MTDPYYPPLPVESAPAMWPFITDEAKADIRDAALEEVAVLVEGLQDELDRRNRWRPSIALDSIDGRRLIDAIRALKSRKEGAP